jgi:acyl-CoA thioesterase-1
VDSGIDCFRELLNFNDGPLDGIILAIFYYGFVSLRTLSSCVYLGVALACHAAGAPQSSVTPALIVAFGDSLSAGYGADPGKSYPDFLQKLIDQSKKNFRVYNAGVSGDTTTDGLGRLPGILAMKPKIVILELGGNDGLRGIPPAVTKANLEKMIQPLESDGAKIVLAGMTLPRNYGATYIHQFEKIYTDLASQYHLTLIPFLLEGVGGHPNLMQRDGIHPTNEGNKLVGATVYKYLKPLL